MSSHLGSSQLRVRSLAFPGAIYSTASHLPSRTERQILFQKFRSKPTRIILSKSRAQKRRVSHTERMLSTSSLLVNLPNLSILKMMPKAVWRPFISNHFTRSSQQSLDKFLVLPTNLFISELLERFVFVYNPLLLFNIRSLL